MAARILTVAYFNVIVRDEPGEAYRVLSLLAAEGVNLLAFNAIPLGPVQTQFVLFPDDVQRFETAAGKMGLCVSGSQQAILVQGDDRLGLLAEIHHKLAGTDVNVYGSNGVTDGQGRFGYVLYVRPEDFDRAASALEV